MQLLLDMNLTPRWVETLISAGHWAVHWSEVGANNASDLDICLYAKKHELVLITNDLDFPRILAHTSEQKPSVVLLRGEPLIPEVRGQALMSAIADCSAELLSGAILTIDWLDRPRARLLPLN